MPDPAATIVTVQRPVPGGMVTVTLTIGDDGGRVKVGGFPLSGCAC